MANIQQMAIEQSRQTFTVPNTAGNYAQERITFGTVTGLSRQASYQAVTALLEDVGSDGTNQAPSGMVCELWLAQVPDGSVPAASIMDANFWFSGQVLVPANVAYTAGVGVVVSYGAATWALAGMPMAQIRVKSGGIGGNVTISASAL